MSSSSSMRVTLATVLASATMMMTLLVLGHTVLAVEAFASSSFSAIRSNRAAAVAAQSQSTALVPRLGLYIERGDSYDGGGNEFARSNRNTNMTTWPSLLSSHYLKLDDHPFSSSSSLSLLPLPDEGRQLNDKEDDEEEGVIYYYNDFDELNTLRLHENAAKIFASLKITNKNNKEIKSSFSSMSLPFPMPMQNIMGINATNLSSLVSGYDKLTTVIPVFSTTNNNDTTTFPSSSSSSNPTAATNSPYANFIVGNTLFKHKLNNKPTTTSFAKPSSIFDSLKQKNNNNKMMMMNKNNNMSNSMRQKSSSLYSSFASTMGTNSTFSPSSSSTVSSSSSSSSSTTTSATPASLSSTSLNAFPNDMSNSTTTTQDVVPVATSNNNNNNGKWKKKAAWKKSSTVFHSTSSYLESLSGGGNVNDADDDHDNDNDDCMNNASANDEFSSSNKNPILFHDDMSDLGNPMDNTNTNSNSNSNNNPNDANYNNNPIKNNDNDNENKLLLQNLRNQQAQLAQYRQEKYQDALREATRRTNPKDAILNRIRKGEEMRKEKERKQLEKLYRERRERLERKQSLEKDRQDIMERFAREKERAEGVVKGMRKEEEEEKAAGDLLPDKNNIKKKKKKKKKNQDIIISTSTNGKRGIPILGPFMKSNPLLLGSTITLSHSSLTPFQKRALEVAQLNHEEHIHRMKLEQEMDTTDVGDGENPFSMAGQEGGIQAAPIIAIIDQFTVSPSKGENKPQKRFATLASIEILDNQNVKLMGVGRVFLHDYFSSKDIGLTKEEEELSKLLELIQRYSGDDGMDETSEHYHDEDEDGNDHYEESDLPVVMAEFDLFLDDSSLSLRNQSGKYEDVSKQRASSMHAITELYRSANKVYRIHEERKRLVAGLQAGKARLRNGMKRMRGDMDVDYDGFEVIEYNDYDGLGLIGGAGGLANSAPSEHQDKEESSPLSKNNVPSSPLDEMENFGLGNFGILSAMPDLTKELMSRLEPYYSPSHREREEYEAEVASFVAFRSLEGYAHPSEVAMALLAPSATERFEMAYDIMMRHHEELQVLVKRINEELTECGEECTDLW